MRWSNFRKMAVSLPLALLAASALVGINEAGYARSNEAVHALSHTYVTRAALNRMMQNMLDAETGLRGYLLTGDERYLQPYQKAASTIDANLEELRGIFAASPEDQEDFTQLSRQISRKMSELDLSLRLRRQNNDDAWKFVLSTDVGKENMDAIRTLAARLIQRSADQSSRNTQEILHSLTLSRIGIATVVVIGLLAFYMYLRQASALQTANQREQESLERERDRLETLVRERTASLTELANHLQQVREDERGHLARELHDELGALLTAAKLDVARLKSKVDAQAPEIAERLKHLTETLNSGIALKRRIIEDLRPSSLFNLGLTASLEILAREFAQRGNVEVDLNLEPVELPESVQLTVYRMVQESLTNIGKYANASKVLVAVHNYPTHVAVQIRDNGAGFDTSKVHTSAHGLMGMRHRVEAAGGRLTVTSEAGEGTLVSAILPVLS
ncbi:CHASE3 domain-containing protein [Paracidovorax anthurii]|uniref:Signal transduction histidine kinase n=1 Tax=Paracidovorax anthurii TaxID=78229 RepID=A0A328YT75_9BURK|nr:CHASE3 domain-containing protein [Paracidovorax anthurii]RAR77049.1 signal transduction histidine kinase [Paracidovorax anthurii]